MTQLPTLSSTYLKSRVVRDASELNAWREAHVDRRLVVKAKVALVPTMGYLHAGHLSLIREARAYADHVIVSIFVNPTQFNDPRDFAAYPRDEEGDINAAINAGADLIFLPTPKVIYPAGSQTRVRVGSLADPLCGATRPGHFEGVCTVVMALFQLTRCDFALFGEKDYQQLAIISRMTQDLHLPTEVIGCPTLRESDGLAMSSRNARLTSRDRESAPAIYQALRAVQASWRRGERSVDLLSQVALELLPGSAHVDYLSICDPISLEPYSSGSMIKAERALVAIACFLGEVRLIDNIMLE